MIFTSSSSLTSATVSWQPLYWVTWLCYKSPQNTFHFIQFQKTYRERQWNYPAVFHPLSIFFSPTHPLFFPLLALIQPLSRSFFLSPPFTIQKMDSAWNYCRWPTERLLQINGKEEKAIRKWQQGKGKVQRELDRKKNSCKGKRSSKKIDCYHHWWSELVRGHNDTQSHQHTHTAVLSHSWINSRCVTASISPSLLCCGELQWRGAFVYILWPEETS